MSRFDKIQEKKRYEGENVFLRLGKYLLLFPFTGLLALFLVFFSNVLSLLGPSLSGKAIDAIAAEGGVQFDVVWENVTKMLICYAASALLSYLLSGGLFLWSF